MLARNVIYACMCVTQCYVCNARTYAMYVCMFTWDACMYACNVCYACAVCIYCVYACDACMYVMRMYAIHVRIAMRACMYTMSCHVM